MVTDYKPKHESFVVGEPRLWSDRQLQVAGLILNYDLAPDGKRFAECPNFNPPTEEPSII